MNVTEDLLKSYIESFHKTLEATAGEFMPSEARGKLLHLSVLPARIVGYISTQFGTAIEYFKNSRTEIEIVKGSARIEDLVFQVPSQFRNRNPFLRVNEENMSIADLSLVGCMPVRLEGNAGRVTYTDVGFEIETWKRVAFRLEMYCDRSAGYWSGENAIRRAKDEVLAAMTDLRKASAKGVTIEGYISEFKRKTVLVLGDYDAEGLRRLGKITKCLVDLGYNPVLIRDIPDHPVQDLSQKVVMVGSAARFVIVDDSSKAGQLAEVPLCKANDWVTILMRHKGKGGSWMTAGARHLSKVILEKEYEEGSEPLSVREAVEWAELRLVELKRAFDSTYPWRKEISGKIDVP